MITLPKPRPLYNGLFTSCTLGAVQFALLAHGRQIRRESHLPYVIHPVRVAHRILRDYFSIFTNPRLASTIAILHDVLEDTEVTESEMRNYFTAEIVAGVKALTKKFGMKEEDYLKQLSAASQDIQSIKFLDRIDNLRDSRAATASWKKTYEAASWRLYKALPGAYPTIRMELLETMLKLREGEEEVSK
jgi:(p)ppGpp synthase/HD superfamily hydrolase